MGAGHDHHAGGRHRWRLAVAVVLVGAFFLVELVVSWLSGSLALLADAGAEAAREVVDRVVVRRDLAVELDRDREHVHVRGREAADLAALLGLVPHARLVARVGLHEARAGGEKVVEVAAVAPAGPQLREDGARDDRVLARAQRAAREEGGRVEDEGARQRAAIASVLHQRSAAPGMEAFRFRSHSPQGALRDRPILGQAHEAARSASGG